jgi:hypothetical protein
MGHDESRYPADTAPAGPPRLMGGRDPGSSLPNDLRSAFDALLASAIGTFAGILVDSGFTVRRVLLDSVYWLLGPIFDLFSRFPNLQLVGIGVVDRLPIVLIAGLAIGLMLRKVRYPRILLCATIVWPVCVVLRRAAMSIFPGAGAGTGDANSYLPEVAIYVLQYALLILIIRLADRAVRPR